MRISGTVSCCGVKEVASFSWTTVEEIWSNVRAYPEQARAMANKLKMTPKEREHLERLITAPDRSSALKLKPITARSHMKFVALALTLGVDGDAHANCGADMSADLNRPGVYPYSYQIFWAQRTFSKPDEIVFYKALVRLDWDVQVIGPSRHEGNGNLRVAWYLPRKQKSEDWMLDASNIVVVSRA